MAPTAVARGTALKRWALLGRSVTLKTEVASVETRVKAGTKSPVHSLKAKLICFREQERVAAECPQKEHVLPTEPTSFTPANH